MRTGLAIVLLIAALLGGCADPETAPPAGGGPGDGGDGGGGNQTGDGGGPGDGEDQNNTAPTANLTADALNGTAPLYVNLTLDGSDADGDDLTWTLSNATGGLANGTTLPAHLNLTLSTGNHTFTLTVDDGRATATANLTIEVQAPVAGPSVEPIFRVLEMVEGCYLCIDSELATGEPMGAPGCVGWNLEDNELDCGWVAFSAEYQGLPYSVFSYTSGTLSPFGSDGHPDVEFYDTCSPDATLIAQHFDQSTDTIVGVIPEGAGCIVGFEFHWPNVGHTIEFSLGAVAHG